jgi:hypothetical protein
MQGCYLVLDRNTGTAGTMAERGTAVIVCIIIRCCFRELLCVIRFTRKGSILAGHAAQHQYKESQ